MVSTNGLPLNFYSEDEYSAASATFAASQAISYLILASAIFFSLVEVKIIGTEMFFLIQFMFMNMIIFSNFTPTMSGVSGIRNIMGFNSIFGQE